MVLLILLRVLPDKLRDTRIEHRPCSRRPAGPKESRLGRLRKKERLERALDASEGVIDFGYQADWKN
jgi:hypothetical protein